MPQVTLRGVPIEFPFEPYDLQKQYMEKVLECLQEETNGVLESPTGTGKTLSLLCSSLAWLQLKKAQIQAQRLTPMYGEGGPVDQLNSELDALTGKTGFGKVLSGIPTIIYASRTHTQLSQAMQELKRSSYRYMKACVLGSREQMCINPEVMREQSNAVKTQLCLLKIKTRTCSFHGRVEKMKEDPRIQDIPVIDIEDLCKLGNATKFCPYFMSKELVKQADIIFMPYNYILDFRMRKTLGISLSDHILILDEAHNVEKICEDTTSLQLKSSDIALAIEEVSAVMKMVTDVTGTFDDSPRDFTAEDLCELKEVLLNFENAIDEINTGQTYEGVLMMELFEKVGVKCSNVDALLQLIDHIIQFLSAVGESDGPFVRKGVALQHLDEVLNIIFAGRTEEFKEKVRRCCKVHVADEEVRKKRQDNWLSKMSTTKAGGKILNYWCFSPGFGMELVMSQGLRSLILTSGTLAPLKPLISELEIDVGVRLENPHIVTKEQVCVKIIPKGPDMEVLNCNFHNRSNPKYVNSLGRTILNVIKVIPDGVLVFFPSYPQMQSCQQLWQESGIWAQIYAVKPIFVEPKTKEAFNSVMLEYYEKINDPNNKGAIFMGVCRGKVSEGLDFADINGRAVMVIGLPYPPFKNPRVELKRKYLDACNCRDKNYLKGQEWYSLEASRAVNQAIGRVIRHRNDYGAILLLDERFRSETLKNQMSMWLKKHVTVADNFGMLLRDLRIFFKNAEGNYPTSANERALSAPVPAEFGVGKVTKHGNNKENNLLSEPSSSSSIHNDGEVKVHKTENPTKRMKISLVPNSQKKGKVDSDSAAKDYILMLQNKLSADSFNLFMKSLKNYKAVSDFEQLAGDLDKIFKRQMHLLWGLENYLKDRDKVMFQEYLQCRS